MSHGQLVTEPQQQLIGPTHELIKTEGRIIIIFPCNKKKGMRKKEKFSLNSWN